MGICHRFINLRTKQLKEQCNLEFMELEEELIGFAPPDKAECLEVLEDLSHDGQEIVRLLLEAPFELAKITTPNLLLKRVQKYLRERGKSKEHIDAACQEVRQVFGQVWQTA